MVRHKNRYIVIEVNPREGKFESFSIKAYNLELALINTVQQMHGDFGVAAIRYAFQARYCNEKTRIAVIKVRHGPHRLLASCLPFTNFKEISVNIRTLFTGATVRQCFKFIVKYQNEQLEKVYKNLKTDDEKSQMKEAFLNFNCNI